MAAGWTRAAEPGPNPDPPRSLAERLRSSIAGRISGSLAAGRRWVSAGRSVLERAWNKVTGRGGASDGGSGGGGVVVALAGERGRAAARNPHRSRESHGPPGANGPQRPHGPHGPHGPQNPRPAVAPSGDAARGEVGRVVQISSYRNQPRGAAPIDEMAAVVAATHHRHVEEEKVEQMQGHVGHEDQQGRDRQGRDRDGAATAPWARSSDESGDASGAAPPHRPAAEIADAAAAARDGAADEVRQDAQAGPADDSPPPVSATGGGTADGADTAAGAEAGAVETVAGGGAVEARESDPGDDDGEPADEPPDEPDNDDDEDGDGEAPTTGEGDGEDESLEGGRLDSIVESLLLAAGAPLTVRRMCDAIRSGPLAKEVRAALDRLTEKYSGASGIHLVEVAGGYQFRTAPANAKFVRALLREKPARLGRAALETLSIIAYKQPATRGEIEAIRGVDADSAINTLLAKRLIKIDGRKETVGRPLLYATTPEFLEVFGLKDLKELPTLKEIGPVPEPDEEVELDEDGEIAAPRAVAATQPREEPTAAEANGSGGAPEAAAAGVIAAHLDDADAVAAGADGPMQNGADPDEPQTAVEEKKALGRDWDEEDDDPDDSDDDEFEDDEEEDDDEADGFEDFEEDEDDDDDDFDFEDDEDDDDFEDDEDDEGDDEEDDD